MEKCCWELFRSGETCQLFLEGLKIGFLPFPSSVFAGFRQVSLQDLQISYNHELLAKQDLQCCFICKA